MRPIRTILKNIIVAIFVITSVGWILLSSHAAFGFPYANDSIWPVLVDHFNLPSNLQQKNVQRELLNYQRNPKYVHQVTKNARSYLFYIYQQTQKYHMPAEIALLPIIESDYKPVARSRAGAVGLWQLMPHTASLYGIKTNWWYEGRCDTITSTHAAIRYLSYLYEEFNHNWLLAIAAYDAGSGAVKNAIRYNQKRGRPTDFWSLPLPRETQIYVPRLLALATIVRHPNTYGFSLAPIPDEAVTSTVVVKKQMNLSTIAHAANISMHRAHELNPALRHQKTPPHQTITVVLPAHKAHFVQKTLQTQHQKIKTPETHSVAQQTVEPKSLLSRLFKKISAKKIEENPQATVAPSHHQKLMTASTYIVKRGDCLHILAVRYHTTIAHLMSLNHLHHSVLQIDQSLRVPIIKNNMK